MYICVYVSVSIIYLYFKYQILICTRLFSGFFVLLHTMQYSPYVKSFIHVDGCLLHNFAIANNSMRNIYFILPYIYLWDNFLQVELLLKGYIDLTFS